MAKPMKIKIGIDERIPKVSLAVLLVMTHGASQLVYADISAVMPGSFIESVNTQVGMSAKPFEVGETNASHKETSKPIASDHSASASPSTTDFLSDGPLSMSTDQNDSSDEVVKHNDISHPVASLSVKASTANVQAQRKEIRFERLSTSFDTAVPSTSNQGDKQERIELDAIPVQISRNEPESILPSSSESQQNFIRKMRNYYGYGLPFSKKMRHNAVERNMIIADLETKKQEHQLKDSAAQALSVEIETGSGWNIQTPPAADFRWDLLRGTQMMVVEFVKVFGFMIEKEQTRHPYLNWLFLSRAGVDKRDLLEAVAMAANDIHDGRADLDSKAILEQDNTTELKNKRLAKYDDIKQNIIGLLIAANIDETKKSYLLAQKARSQSASERG